MRTLPLACASLPRAPCTVARAEMGPPIDPAKRILGFAVKTVERVCLKEHVAEIKRLPLDGLVIFVYPDDWGARKTGQEGLFSGRCRFSGTDFRQAEADLRATWFGRFPDNFIQVETSARGSAVSGRPEDGNRDWFDPAWSGIAANGAAVAALAKDAGFKGLFQDVEHYAGALGPWQGQHLFDYAACPSRESRSLAEVGAQVQLMGRQFMAAVSAAYPDITIVIIQNTGWGVHRAGAARLLDRRGAPPAFRNPLRPVLRRSEPSLQATMLRHANLPPSASGPTVKDLRRPDATAQTAAPLASTPATCRPTDQPSTYAQRPDS